MLLYEKVRQEVERKVTALRTMQYQDGAWRFCFEGSPLTDCHMIFLLRLLGQNGEMEPFVTRVASLQTNEGTWKLYEDESVGNLSTTINAYVALLASGRYTKEDINMKRAEAFIRRQGGITKAHFMTKFLLALHGGYEYPSLFHFPTPMLFLPEDSPLSIFELSSSARIHLIPMMICMNKRFTVSKTILPNLDYISGGSKKQWFREERSPLFQTLLGDVKKFLSYPLSLQHKGYKEAERFMIKRIETNGTLYSYASATFYMIYALLALGHSIQSQLISNAVLGLKSYIWNMNKGTHLQNSPSTVWDTALLSYSLQEARVPHDNKMIHKATDYLLQKQHKERKDWSVHAPILDAGGWGFSDINTTIPDIDDTTATLRALARSRKGNQKVEEAWKKGIEWVRGLQNIDGGWAAFERGVTNRLLADLPLDNAGDMTTDPSTSDITGRVLEFFGTYAPHQLKDDQKDRAIKWLMQAQEKNGSWYGKWGVCYIYGTWAALTGLRAVGVPSNHTALQKAVTWLEGIQHNDGGWGESCRSSIEKHFISLPFSTPSQTAWALDALITFYDTETPVIRKGISYLLAHLNQNQDYPTGIGLPDGFYIRYHSYHHIFPILTFAHYIKKYMK
ncbi:MULTISPECIES: terpene cyclase/mutase family protein [Bacillus]|uniref:terpene cyclase/mutase family protein n=1 Tax=Bacillus TaxID=1386 RepID=UPI000BEBEBFF|nr:MULTISPECIES: prenyltransferase/squalene oxidase repeat-containing protein [Bacillus]MCX2827901.1 squalene--hopene cyclase [Bacillus sp. DHT2]MDR4916017.1 prenyltransferase/squalene oxidase repeat-containing protein [Bacillus pseudomycoides]MED4650993.1 prenyltransferase/squalene oxidase repeat-containing protein [Bacillus pseudomycoides]PEE03825.1 squalene--hopene cyclase [Bacillus pseudomycoides]PEM75558.1 squalene--hopene cyclase [Bacillus pseudomycoides]